MSRPAPVWNPHSHPSIIPETATNSKYKLCKQWGLDYTFTKDPDCMQVWPGESPNGYSMAVCPHVKEPCKCCDHVPAEQDTIIIAVDGACRLNGRVAAKGAYGVYINERSKYNKCNRLPQNTAPPTNQVAELWAGYYGIMTAVQMAKSEKLVEKVKKMMVEDGVVLEEEMDEGRQRTFLIAIIKADSEYLVKAMTSWIGKWKSNGWKTTKGGLVINRDLIEKVQEAVDYANGEGIEVQFWYVPREYNQDADELANIALDVRDSPRHSYESLRLSNLSLT